MKKTTFSIAKITAVFLLFLLCLNASGQSNNTKSSNVNSSLATALPTVDYMKEAERFQKELELKKQNSGVQIQGDTNQIPNNSTKKIDQDNKDKNELLV